MIDLTSHRLWNAVLNNRNLVGVLLDMRIDTCGPVPRHTVLTMLARMMAMPLCELSY